MSYSDGSNAAHQSESRIHHDAVTHGLTESWMKPGEGSEQQDSNPETIGQRTLNSLGQFGGFNVQHARLCGAGP